MRASIARATTVVMIVVALGLAAPVGAFAGGYGQGSTITSKSTQQAMKAFKASEVVINKRFRASIAAAKGVLRAGLASANSPGERTTVRIHFTLAVIAASTERDAELVQLGPAPDGSSTNGGGSGAARPVSTTTNSGH